MIVNPNRDLIIIGHPRSGSYWLQSCMSHFNCREAFNTVNFDILRIEEDRFFLSKFKDVTLPKDLEDIEIQSRIDWIKQVTVPKCVKILTFQFQYAERKEYNQTIFDWVNEQDADICWIKRRDREASLRSILIADALGVYVGKIPQTSVTIDLARLPWLIDSISYSRDEYIRSKITKPIHDVVYEDLLNDPNFDKSKSKMIEQHSSDVEITNYDDVLAYIEKHGLVL